MVRWRCPEALQKDSDAFKLTLGIGVVFGKHTIPTHRLHGRLQDRVGSMIQKRTTRLVGRRAASDGLVTPAKGRPDRTLEAAKTSLNGGPTTLASLAGLF